MKTGLGLERKEMKQIVDWINLSLNLSLTEEEERRLVEAWSSRQRRKGWSQELAKQVNQWFELGAHHNDHSKKASWRAN